jgi:carbonic anhydrase/acetyltransferase-like protein (isoleucine patch superfamily)
MALYEFNGKRPEVPEDSFVHPSASLIGDVKIGHECLIAPGVSIRADFGPVVVGNRSSIQDNAVIHVYPGSRCVIGDDVIVAHGVILHDVHIKSRCMIGIGSIILFNVVCDEDVIVSVGSLVPKGMHIPAGKFVAGNPAQIIRDTSDKDKAAAHDGVEAYRYLCRTYLSTMKLII